MNRATRRRGSRRYRGPARGLALALVLGWNIANPAALAAADPAPSAIVANRFAELLALSEEQLQDIKVTISSASKHDQSPDLAPSSVTLLQRSEIRQSGYRTLAEALQSVRGFYVTSDRTYSYLGVRGFGRPSDYNGRILLLVDGHRVNEGIYSSALLGTEFPLDLDLAERIEVVRGPGASLYGDNAFFGVVNVVTRTTTNAVGEASIAAGTWETYRGRFSTGGTIGGAVNLFLSGSYFESAGERTITFADTPGPDGEPLVSRGMDGEQGYQGFLKLQWKDLVLEGAYGLREKLVPTTPYGTILNDDRSKATDTRPFAELRYENNLDAWTVSARGYYDYYHYEGDYPLEDPTLPAGSAVDRDAATAEWVGFEGSVARTFDAGHRVVVGAELRHNLRQDQLAYRVDPYEEYFHDEHRSTSTGAYLQAELALGTHVWLNLGGRYDHIESYEDRFNPRLAAVYQPAEGSTLKLLYGTAFRAPNIFESRYQGPSYLRNPDLQPEEIQTYELACEQRLLTNLVFSSSFYHYAIQGLIDPRTLPSGDLTSVNGQDALAYGIEFGLEQHWARGGLARISYASQKAQDRQSRTRLSNCPANLVQATLQLPLADQRLFASLNTTWVDGVSTEDGKAIDPYLLVNLGLHVRNPLRCLDGLEASLTLHNAFDEGYANAMSPVNISSVAPQPGRSLSARLSYRF